MKYRVSYKAKDFAISNNLAKAEDMDWDEIMAVYPQVKSFFESQGYHQEGDLNFTTLFTRSQPKLNRKFWAVVVDFDEKHISFEYILKNEDGYFPAIYGYFENYQILKFFDRLGFIIKPEAAKETDEDIMDWWGQV